MHKSFAGTADEALDRGREGGPADDSGQGSFGGKHQIQRHATTRTSTTPNKLQAAGPGKRSGSPLSFERSASFVVDESNTSQTGRRTVRSSKSPMNTGATRGKDHGRATVVKSNSSSACALSFISSAQTTKGNDKKAKLKKYQQLLDSEKKRQQRAFEYKTSSAKAKSDKQIKIANE